MLGDLLDGVVASEVVHHVTFGAEALATGLRALKGAMVIVHAHMHLQVVPVVERFTARRHTAEEIRLALVVCQVSLELLMVAELLLAALKGALEGHFYSRWVYSVAMLASEALFGLLELKDVLSGVVGCALGF